MVLLISCISSVSQAVVLKSFSVAPVSNYKSKVSLFFTAKPKYHQFILNRPSRIVFDFSDLTMLAPISKIANQSPLIEKVRFARRGKNNIRLVLDVVNNTKISSKIISNKLEFILFKKEQIKKAILKPKVRDVVVVIDPGHGGKDPGAVGHQKTQEKRVVLEIAKRLKRLIDSQTGMKAHLTRRGDYYVGLRQRLALGRKYNADIFVSIHADAFKNTRSRGASVYSLSQRGATSEAARWLAAKENHSELGGVDLSELDDQNGMVRSVLIDLSQTATIGASLSLGENVLGDLNTIAKLHHKSVEQARFVVLKSPDIPSILVETGFISNKYEERLLASRSYQQKLAASILKGIKHYFWQHPPHGHRSFLASSK